MFCLVRVTTRVQGRRHMIMEEWQNGDEWGKTGKDSVKELCPTKILHDVARN